MGFTFAETEVSIDVIKAELEREGIEVFWIDRAIACWWHVLGQAQGHPVTGLRLTNDPLGLKRVAMSCNGRHHTFTRQPGTGDWGHTVAS